MPNDSQTVKKIDFLGISLEYDSRVLTPRLETEALVLGTLRYFRNRELPDIIIDVGTGSGAIILSLTSRFPCAEFHAVDISEEALQVAEKNAKSLGIMIEFHQGNLLKYFLNSPEKCNFSNKNILVIANLPYIGPNEEIGEDVLMEDPAIALYGWGERGFDLIHELLEQSQILARFSKRLHVALEFWHTQLSLVESWAIANRYVTESWKDYSEIPRFSIIDYGNR